MPIRPASHPVTAVIPAGTAMLLDTGEPVGVFKREHTATIYRWKRRGRWINRAMVDSMTVAVFNNTLKETIRRRVYVNWTDCRLVFTK